MSSVKFNLKNATSSESLVIAYCYIGEPRPLRFSTGIIVPVRYWNNKTQRVREIAELQTAKLINAKIKKFEDFINEYYLLNTKISREALRSELLKFVGKSNEVIIPDSFFLFFEFFNHTFQSRSNYSHYKSCLEYLKKTMPDRTIDKIDYDYIEKFVKIYSTTPIERGVNKGSLPSLNTISDKVKTIKAVLHYAEKKGLSINRSIDNYEKKTEDSDSVYLSLEEINSIYELKLEADEEITRDLFIIGCFTALRVSDYIHLKKENIRDNLCYKTAKKTSERVVIPLHPIVRQILEKYNYNLPKTYDQKINRQIKDIAEKAGINELITWGRTEGGKHIERISRKYELISSHTARRSGATNMYLAGIPTISIMMITGHRTEKSFLKYIRVTKEQNATQLSKHPYFLGIHHPYQEGYNL